MNIIVWDFRQKYNLKGGHVTVSLCKYNFLPLQQILMI